uniref:DUF4378 domain-containing protein n=1 Tax=Davidia involucrata TaxID=16924 RepID=A0A5B6YRI1_DAVIN
MEVEKQGSKGGFLQLFDWNVKSRKKLFSTESELPETKQGKENLDSSATSQLQQMQVHENGPVPSVKGSNDYNCASSMSDDEGCGTRAPGVVARLMGLDSLPTSNVYEPCFTPYFESHSFRDLHSQRSTTDFQSEHHIINYGNMINKLEGNSRNPVELRLQKVQSRAIERFQTEILPPKSAKNTPITHRRLFSPIKSPAFIPTKNASYIMEAAAKIIEQSSQSTTKGKMPSFGSSKVPLRIPDLKEKMEATRKASRLPEASQRPREPSSFKYMKGQPSEGSQSGSQDTQLCKASVDAEKSSSDSLKNKGKSVSLAIQAKANVQRREGLTSGGNRSSMNQKEDNEGKLGRFDKSQPNVQKTAQKRTSTSRTCGVLRQNNQKQNCVSNKDRVSSKPLVSNQQDRKSLFTNGSLRPSKTVNKVVVNSATGTRKMNSVATSTGKDHSSKSKNSSRKRRPVSSDVHFDESVIDNDVLINKNERSVKCNVSVDGCMNWDAAERKDSMDVVSFTFTSPIKKPIPGSQSSGQVMEKNERFYANPYNDQPDLKNSTLSSLGLNVIGGDTLSVLLEQKLEGLTCRVESSHCNSVNTGAASGSVSSLQDSVSTRNEINTTPTVHDERFLFGLQKDKLDGLYDFNFSSVDALLVKAKQKWHGSVEMEEQTSSSNSSDYGKELDCQYPSPVSSLEPSFSDGSSNGGKHFLSAEAHEMVDCISDKKPQTVEDETELSDSASSMSTGGMDRKDTTTTTSFIDFKRSSNWELEYVRDILCNAELMLKDFALGQVHKVINPDLFDQLENQITGSNKNMEEFSKLGRKVLFDCVSEYLELRCEWLFHGSCKSWAKWARLFQRKGWLAEELYREISGLTSMGDLMVDELVDKDMSTQNGKWVDFETEAFEEGVEIEKGILASLVDEMVTDLLLF